MTSAYRLALSCEDRPGIVADITTRLLRAGGNITDAQQYNDPLTKRFFMRIVFNIKDIAAFRANMKVAADMFNMQWKLRREDRKTRVLIAVSKFDHCLVDLLYRTRLGDLPMDIVGIISNHARDAIRISNLHGAPFHHLPITKATKSDQETQFQSIIKESKAELVVLARYMQILSDEFAVALAGRCVNIHHSFLPGFKGARPYHQAHARGVKMIGATAHFVTPDLDEGPIIAQGVEPIRHSDTPDRLVAKGRAIEQRVLSEAVKALVEDRVFLNGHRTVVFN
jgi:formyltetrahydrofolate deformylase